MITGNTGDNSKDSFISGSGRRFVSDAPSQLHYTSFETKNLLRSYLPEAAPAAAYERTFLASLEPHAALNRDRLTLSFNIISNTTGHHYVLKDILAFLKAVEFNENVSYGKHLEFVHRMSLFCRSTQKIIRFLISYFRERQSKDNLMPVSGSSMISYTYAKGHSKQIELLGHEIDEFFSCVSSIYFVNNDFRARYTDERLLEIERVFPSISLNITRDKNGVTFESSAFTMFEGHNYIYFERRKRLHAVELENAEPVLPFLRFLSARRTENELFVSDKDLPLFVEGLFPILKDYFNLSCNGFEASRYLPDTPLFRLYLDMPSSDTITCDVKAVYKTENGDELQVQILDDSQSSLQTQKSDDSSVKRNFNLERQTSAALSGYFDRIDTSIPLFVLSADDSNYDKLYSFISDNITPLSALGEIYLSDNIKSVNITSAPKVNMGVSVVSDLLHLSMVPENLTPEELNDILSKYDRRRKFYKLKNGDILKLTGEDMELMYSLKDGLGLSSKEILTGNALIPKYRALFLEDLAKRSSDYEYTHLSRGGDFKKLISSFAETTDKRFKVPESLKDVLRDYQKSGFIWLRTLRQNSFGGILADDMGLGKTLQVLALLLSLKEEAENEGRKNTCSLIVCPASLVYNWQHEIKRFTPSLKCELAVGIKPDRERITAEIDEEETDVIITSYDLLRRDIDLYKYLTFECMVVDEAQFIKNPTTQISKAVKSISASFKTALTGTPIENRLSELWSIFDFCMPGYLFNYKSFKENIEIPAVQDRDDSAMRRLKKMIAPFVIRRLKKDVLTDLPDKLEENIYAKMTDGQRQLYQAHLQRVKMMVGLKTEDDIKKDRIMILSELTRLRQLCCDPGLIYEGYDGGSAKALLCVETIRSAIESGHKVLLFSQFTSMLERLTAIFKKEQISYYLLTGSTKKEDRIRMVDAFQEDDTSVFCISLKAGGTGLNLTAADIVIHYDHWWNIAVENQATDRAHRIGQKNVVTVYRLIMKDTIEDRIIELQNKKKELADQLLNTGSLSSPTLSKKELLDLLG